MFKLSGFILGKLQFATNQTVPKIPLKFSNFCFSTEGDTDPEHYKKVVLTEKTKAFLNR